MQKKFRDMKGGSPNERMIGRMASLIVYVQEGLPTAFSPLPMQHTKYNAFYVRTGAAKAWSTSFKAVKGVCHCTGHISFDAFVFVTVSCSAPRAL